MHEFLKWAGIGAGVFIGLGFFVWITMFSVMLYRDYDRAMAMLGGLTLFIRGVRRKEGHKHHHRRRTDVEAHEHVRKAPRASLLMTITDFARRPTPRPKERDHE